MLLVVVIARMERGLLTTNQIRFDELEREYEKAFEAATDKRPRNLMDPFVRMSTASFWSIQAPEGVEVRPTKRVLCREDVWAEFDATTYGLLSTSSEIRQRIIAELTRRWIPEKYRESLAGALLG